MKRQRGRSRRSGGGPLSPNRHFESNGPDVKLRGTAQQVLDKYLQYARDAQTSGDRVMSEAYFQHAEHYQRLLAAIQAAQKPKRERGNGNPSDGEASEREEAKSEADANGATGRDGGEQPVMADPLKVIDGEPAAGNGAPPEAGAGSEDEPKSKRRRSYRKRGETADAEAPSGEDGVMKTLARGRKSDDASEPASAGEETTAD